MLDAQKQKRKYKFMTPEFMIPRNNMIKKVSKIIAIRIKEFMARILADEIHCVDQNHKHEDVREVSMLFKELNFGSRMWNVEIPTSGFSSLLPLFSFKTKMIK